MGIQTGIVMEVLPGEVTVLSSTGEFRKVKIRGKMPELGTVMSLPPTRTKKDIAGSWVGWVAAAAAALLIFVSPWALPGKDDSLQVVSYVTVDINPSIQLALDDEEKVLATRPWNEDGEKLLARVDLKGLSAEKAVESITLEAVKSGYIGKEKENTVIFTVSPGAKEVNPVLETNLRQTAQKVLDNEKLAGKVQTLKATEQVLEVAEKQGISPGKLVILAEMENVKANDVTVEDIKNMSISEAIKTAGMNPEELIDKAHKDTRVGTIDLGGDKFRAINPVKNAEGGDKNVATVSETGKDKMLTYKEKPDKRPVVNTDKTMKEPKKPIADSTPQEPVSGNGGTNNGEISTGSDDTTGSGNGVPVIPKPRVENGVYESNIR
ncbi:MAG: anti-sigma-I factor RsgI family protein [Thermincolia bacterium]